MSNKSSEELKGVLNEYSGLPEYSEMNSPAINTKSLFGDYPINIAATRGLTNEIMTLISNGADVNARGEHGYTPLHSAVEQGHVEAAKLLLKHGANITMKNDDGDTPIQLSELLQEHEIYRLLKTFTKTGMNS